MLEILILSILGFAGTAIGGLVSSGDDEDVTTVEESAEAEEDTGNDLLLGSDDDDILNGTDADDQIALGAGDDTSQSRW